MIRVSPFISVVFIYYHIHKSDCFPSAKGLTDVCTLVCLTSQHTHYTQENAKTVHYAMLSLNQYNHSNQDSQDFVLIRVYNLRTPFANLLRVEIIAVM